LSPKSGVVVGPRNEESSDSMLDAMSKRVRR
jgi:hypothetical protein